MFSMSAPCQAELLRNKASLRLSPIFYLRSLLGRRWRCRLCAARAASLGPVHNLDDAPIEITSYRDEETLDPHLALDLAVTLSLVPRYVS